MMNANRQILIWPLVCAAAVLSGCGTAPAAAPPKVAATTKQTAQAAKNSSPASDPDAATTPDKGDEGTQKKESTVKSEATPPVAQPKPKSKSSEVQKISFDDLNCGMQADIQFREWMLSDRVKELDGQRVQVSGYMLPFDKQKGISEFVLLRNTECKFGPGGQADHLIRITLDKGVTTSYSIKPVEVVGTLKVNPFSGPDGNTWSIYDLAGESVKPLRR